MAHHGSGAAWDRTVNSRSSLAACSPLAAAQIAVVRIISAADDLR
jgi:hypothetical protein